MTFANIDRLQQIVNLQLIVAVVQIEYSQCDGRGTEHDLDVRFGTSFDAIEGHEQFDELVTLIECVLGELDLITFVGRQLVGSRCRRSCISHGGRSSQQTAQSDQFSFQPPDLDGQHIFGPLSFGLIRQAFELSYVFVELRCATPNRLGQFDCYMKSRLVLTSSILCSAMEIGICNLEWRFGQYIIIIMIQNQDI